MLKLICAATALSLYSILAGCNPKPEIQTHRTSKPSDWPPISYALDCMADSGPIIAAHRGRDKSKRQAENSLGALKSLKKDGFIMAEIDITQLRDGTLIAFHDGIWDKISTGKGPTSRSRWEEASKLLLKTRRGTITAQRPPKLSDILLWADQQFYLEIDFKSSANERAVIEEIHEAGMTEHVILIAYSEAQYFRLKKLSKEITGSSNMISASARSALKSNDNKLVAWMGNDSFDLQTANKLKTMGTPLAYGVFSPKYADKKAPFKTANIIVTDYPEEAKALIKVRKRDDERLKACR